MGNKRDYMFFNGLSLIDIFNDLVQDHEPLFNSDYDIKNIYPFSFPPVNISLKANKDLLFEFAVAAYNQEDIDISFIEDSMILDLKKVDENIKEGDTWLLHGIKHSGQKNKYYVPSAKYNTDNSTATLAKGLLSVLIPCKEEVKPRKLLISN